MSTGRAQLWGDLPVDRHLVLVDDALDSNDAQHERFTDALEAAKKELKAEMHRGFAECKEDSKGQRRLLTGLLVSVVASCVVILISLVAVGAPG